LAGETVCFFLLWFQSILWGLIYEQQNSSFKNGCICMGFNQYIHACTHHPKKVPFCS
jgi:hypothetical protein